MRHIDRPVHPLRRRLARAALLFLVVSQRPLVARVSEIMPPLCESRKSLSKPYGARRS